MLRFYTLFIFCLFLVHCKNDKDKVVVENTIVRKQNSKDYIDFKYDKVIAFASVNPMDYYGDDFNKKIDVKKIKDTISKTLNLNQIEILNNILSGRNNFTIDSVTTVADCFYPRHNIIFLNENKIVNHIAICFECNDIKSSKQPLASMGNFEEFFNSIGLKVFYNPIEHKGYYDSLKLSNKNIQNNTF
ncbi:hypothetical protein ACFQO9_06955 [Chryseobacterium zhengzhouense]|uniref:DUF4840 domain-containing protein n=1 Tax=Chryseobacterium zhengzhouense TaxID=1636086 RepID=A0ABW2LV63_9FLAO